MKDKHFNDILAIENDILVINQALSRMDLNSVDMKAELETNISDSQFQLIRKASAYSNLRYALDRIRTDLNQIDNALETLR